MGTMRVPALGAHEVRLVRACSRTVTEECESAMDRVAGEQGAPVYMTWDWLKSWWEFYGGNREFALVLVGDRDQVVGFVPWYIDSVGLLGLRRRVARIVGANVPPKTFDPPIGGCSGDAVESMVRALFEQSRCDLVCLGPVSASWRGKKVWQRAIERLSASGYRWQYRRLDVRTIFLLPATFEEFVAKLSSGERKGRLKRLRQLSRSCHLVADVVSDADRVEAAFEEFVELHQRQWRSAGRPGHFGAWPKAVPFNRQLVTRQAEHGRVRFYRLVGDGQLLASRYTYLFGRTLYSELPARATGGDWDRRGVGICSMLKFVEQAIGEGISCIDSGIGHYEHKENLGGTEEEVGTWYIWKSGVVQGLLTRLSLMASRYAIDMYRKLWYRRIHRHLPREWQRPQSEAWLRYDF